MRFPWLQVDADFIGAHAGDLGVLLGISRREAMGLALDLWTWALARTKGDSPPDGLVTGTGAEPDRLLAGSVGYSGPAEQFSAALVAVGMAVRVDGGYRLTGFSRYKATWEKNRRRPGGKPERHRSGTGDEPSRKTQTQTQKDHASHGEGFASPPSGSDATRQAAEGPGNVAGDAFPEAIEDELEAEVEAAIEGIRAPEERPVLELKPQTAGPKPRPKQPEFVLYENLETAREEQCQKHGVGFVPSRWPAGRVLKQLGPHVKATPEARARFGGAIDAYFEDPIALTREPPFSLEYFLKCLSRYEGRAVQAAGGGA